MFDIMVMRSGRSISLALLSIMCSLNNCINDPNTDQVDADGDVCDPTDIATGASSSSGGGGQLDPSVLLLAGRLIVLEAGRRRY
jgi:hypothetical protein